MNLKDQLFIIRNRLFEKRNIILIIVLTIIFLIIFTCLTSIQFSIENKNEIYKSEVGRTYSVQLEDNQVSEIDTIRKIEHVELFENYRYYQDESFEISEFDKENQKGEIIVKPLAKSNDVKIKKGRNLEEKYEMICSDTFYPHYYDEKINSSLFLRGKEILNKELKINSKNQDLNNKEITLKIIGTYKNKFMQESNTCYVNMDTYNEIASKYWGGSMSYDGEGNPSEIQYFEYEETDCFIRIDNKKNIKEVLSKLDDMNVEYEKIFYLDEGFIAMLFFIPTFIGIIIIILTLSILYSFISKKINNRIHTIGILKAIGYNDETIISLNINENILVILISSLISLLIYVIVLNSIKYTLLAEVTYNNYILNVPYVLIIICLVILSFIIIKIIKSKLQKIFNSSVQSLLEK